MWNLIASAGVVVAIVGLIAVVRPIAALRIPTRRRAVVAFASGVVLLAIGAVNDPATQERGAAQRAAEENAADAPAPIESDTASAVASAATFSATSPSCVEVVGASAKDRDAALAFCTKGISTGAVDGIIAHESLLHIKVPRAMADAMRKDRASTEQLVKTWMRGWRQHTGLTAVTITVEWMDVEIAKGDTTVLSGDRVTIR